MFHLSRNQLLARAILCFVVGVLILWLTAAADAGNGMFFASMFFLPGVGFLVWRQLKVGADRRRRASVAREED